MIRFRTVEPGAAQTRAAKEQTPAPAAAAPDAPEPAGDDAPAAKGKGPTRKTPLRAKKPGATGLFRD